VCQAQVPGVQGVPGGVRGYSEIDPRLIFFGLGDNHLSGRFPPGALKPVSVQRVREQTGANQKGKPDANESRDCRDGD